MNPAGPTTRPGRHPPRPGFTLVEGLLVVIIGAILLAIVLPSASRMRDNYAVTNARNAYISLASRARAVAVERGGQARLVLKPAASGAWIVHSSGDTIEALDFADDFAASIATTNGDSIRVCYTSRGFADDGCTTAGLPVTVSFTKGIASAKAQVRPLGQVEMK